MAENFKGPKAKAPAKKRATAKKPAASSKTAGLRQLREKAAETAASNLVTSATGEIITQNLKTVEDFVSAGSIVWRKTLDSILLMSRIMDLAHDRLSKDGYQELIKKLHMSDSSANQLRKITSSPRIEKLVDQGVTLPASAHTLYLLSTMSDDEFKDFEKSHDVDADVRVEDVRSFLKDRAANKPPKTPKDVPATTTQAVEQAQAEVANQMTAPIDRAGAEDAEIVTEGGENAEVVSERGNGEDDTLQRSEVPAEAIVATGMAATEGQDVDLTPAGNIEALAAKIMALKPESIAALDLEQATRVLTAIDNIARHIAEIRDDVETDVFNRS